MGRPGRRLVPDLEPCGRSTIVTGLDEGLGLILGGLGRKTGGLAGLAAAAAEAGTSGAAETGFLGAAVGLGGVGRTGGDTAPFVGSVVGVVGVVGLREGSLGLAGGETLPSAFTGGILGEALGWAPDAC